MIGFFRGFFGRDIALGLVLVGLAISWDGLRKGGSAQSQDRSYD
jgi:hypothetical protein